MLWLDLSQVRTVKQRRRMKSGWSTELTLSSNTNTICENVHFYEQLAEKACIHLCTFIIFIFRPNWPCPFHSWIWGLLTYIHCIFSVWNVNELSCTARSTATEFNVMFCLLCFYIYTAPKILNICSRNVKLHFVWLIPGKSWREISIEINVTSKLWID